ncbi:hypothetical protein SAMN02745248_02413 [Hathewaya proteolytica DSM 3090]|uniref:Uncharacterized protein n=1 Tax=Hathewaya proteolytica DSM 3090 TaxID=1121331 RepID=A0A1M6S0F2_9CLOT|nr:hypothetical protein [Hathewaya proteolytica]SHK38244.1 hypothetical protein SAMN02745248_02413 [Hathewaya proteolytica DSM 3090]
MELERPKFMDTDYYYYDDDGLKIKENSPQWVKEEYEQFMSSLKCGEIVQEYKALTK